MEVIELKGAHISAENCSKQVIFGDWAYHNALSKYVIIFHNLTNSKSVTSSSLCHSIVNHSPCSSLYFYGSWFFESVIESVIG